MSSSEPTRVRGEQANPRPRIRALRGASRMKLAELADAINVEPTQLRRWESGRELVPMDVAQRLARGFCVSLDHLLGTELSEADTMILLVAGMSDEHRDVLESCYEVVGDALAVLPDDKRCGLVRLLRDVREDLGYAFADEASS